MINIIFNKADYEISQRKIDMFEKYNKVIQWGRREPVKFMELFFGLQFTDHQRYVLLSTWDATYAVWLMSRNSGKCLSLDTPIYMPTQDRGLWEDRYPQKTIGALKIGDKIFDETGKLTEVIHLNPVIFEDVYEVEFEDGEIIECNMEHLWSVYDRNFLKRKEEKITCLRNTGFLYDNFKHVYSNNPNKIEYRFHIPCNAPIEYANIQYLSIDPYTLGYWLGDGSQNKNMITIGEEDLEDVSSILKEKGNILKIKKDNDRNTYSVYLNQESMLQELGMNRQKAKSNSFLTKISKLGLYKNKHIPKEYMFAPVKDRLALLQGIMDSDGHCDKDGHCEISQAEYHLDLLKDISKLLSSLGIKNNIHEKKAICNGKEFNAYRISFRTDKRMPCFRMQRKYDRLPDILEGVTKTKAVVDVRKTNKKKAMRCITVSNDTGLFLCGNNHTVTHNSYLSAPYMMARSLLIPNHKSYIMCPSGNQAKQTFSKIEDLAKGKIASVQGVTSVFINELTKANSGTDGFVHDKHSYFCELFNGSTIQTLNSIAKNEVGQRSHLNFYDEAGKVERDFFDLTEPFCTQDRDFVTGANFNIQCMPKQMPNQMIYASSAESIDSRLYDIYKESALRMIGGDMSYFCCDITCELSLHPYLDGKPYRPLLSQDVIDNALRMNEFRANREYFNKFDLSGGQDALVKRTTILANSYAYVPIYFNDTNERIFLIAYDPATKIDNSMIGIAELITDEEKGLMLKMVNLINLIEILPNGDKKTIQKPDQVEMLKSIILDYNGRVPDYDNISSLTIDAGSGGGGFDIAQYLLRDWKGKDGKMHLGFIDLNDKYLKLERDKFPGASDKLTMANFTGQKIEMYQACQDMINQGLVMFPKSLNLKLEMEFEEVLEDGTVNITCERMGTQEIKTLVEFDMMKEELVAMQKIKQGNTVKFDLLPSKKAESMHDDRADVCAMLCWQLSLLRKDELLNIDTKTDGFSKLFKHGLKKQKNIFTNQPNPFLANSRDNPFLMR